MKYINTLILSIILFSACKPSFELDSIDIDNGFLPGKNSNKTKEAYNVAERMNHYKIAGTSVALVNNGKLQWAKGYGIANSESGSKVDVNTLFQAASISKPVAALAALKLVENETLRLDINVNTYLKDWKVPENEYTINEKVTLRRLLDHTAGMTVHGFGGYKSHKNVPNTLDVLNGMGNSPKVLVNSIPGEAWRYSGGGYTVMQKLVEDITGVPFNTYADQHVLKAMDMTNSTFQEVFVSDNNVSAAYNHRGRLIKGLWHNYPEKAAAGLWTTPGDLAKYCIEIQNILNGKENGILSKQLINQMLSKSKNDWGLGVSLSGEGNNLIFQHDGKNEGFTNSFMAFANTGRALIIMTNSDNGGELINEITQVVSEEYGWAIDK